MELPAIVVEADAPKTNVAVSSVSGSSALRAFREATGWVLVELPADAARPSIDPLRGARVLRIEEALRAARAPLDLGDRSHVDALRAAIAVAYGEARAHPEDPEAPFLAAESLRTLARIEELVGDVDGARALRGRADRLDGGRAIGLSEGLSAGAGNPTSAPTKKVELALIGAGNMRVFVDGTGRDAWSALELAEGEHHVRVVARNELEPAHSTQSDGATLAATWFAVGEGTTRIELRLANAIVPCSREDLRAAEGESFAVQCPRWAHVTRTRTSLMVRVCARTACDPATTWLTSAPSAPTSAPLAPVTSETNLWKSPWTWVAIGAATVVGGTITAWQLGAFDRPEPPPPTWRWEGVR